MASIQIEKEYDEMLNQLKGRLQKSKKHIIENAIRYVHHNKIDPENIKTGDPVAAIKKVGDDIKAFIITQEKNKLDPMLHKLSVMVKNIDEKSIQTLSLEELKTEILPLHENFKKMINAYAALSDRTFKQSPELSRQMLGIKEQLDSLTTKLNSKS